MPAGNANRRERRILVPLLVLAGAALLVVLVLALQGGSSFGSDAVGDDPGAGAVEVPGAPDLSSHERRDPADTLAAGPVDAPVGLVVFSDYQCGFCARWSHETLPVMMELADAGKLRIEWRDINVFGEASERAARASLAAGKQGKFWQYHDALYPNGEKRSEAELSEASLTELAVSLGLDATRFTSDFTSPETASEIAANAQLGIDLGAASTPVFLLGGQPIAGAQPTEVFVQAYEAALAASARTQG